MNNTLTLNNPLSDSDWAKIFDAEFEKTEHVFFTTLGGKRVDFVKADAIKQKIDEELGRPRTINRYNEGYTDGILYVWKVLDNILNGVQEE